MFDYLLLEGKNVKKVERGEYDVTFFLDDGIFVVEDVFNWSDDPAFITGFVDDSEGPFTVTSVNVISKGIESGEYTVEVFSDENIVVTFMVCSNENIPDVKLSFKKYSM